VAPKQLACLLNGPVKGQMFHCVQRVMMDKDGNWPLSRYEFGSMQYAFSQLRNPAGRIA
jgi:hypothetical protein